MFDGTALGLQEGDNFRRRGVPKMQIKPTTHKKHLLSSIEYHSGGRMGKRSFRKEVEILSEAEKKIIDILAEKAARVGEQEQQLVLAYAAGLADGARSAKAD